MTIVLLCAHFAHFTTCTSTLHLCNPVRHYQSSVSLVRQSVAKKEAAAALLFTVNRTTITTTTISTHFTEMIISIFSILLYVLKLWQLCCELLSQWSTPLTTLQRLFVCPPFLPFSLSFFFLFVFHSEAACAWCMCGGFGPPRVRQTAAASSVCSVLKSVGKH